MAKSCTPHFNDLMAARGGKGGTPGFTGAAKTPQMSGAMSAPQTGNGMTGQAMPMPKGMPKK